MPTEDGSNISSGTHWSNHLSDAVQEKLKKKKSERCFQNWMGQHCAVSYKDTKQKDPSH